MDVDMVLQSSSSLFSTLISYYYGSLKRRIVAFCLFHGGSAAIRWGGGILPGQILPLLPALFAICESYTIWLTLVGVVMGFVGVFVNLSNL